LQPLHARHDLAQHMGHGQLGLAVREVASGHAVEQAAQAADGQGHAHVVARQHQARHHQPGEGLQGHGHAVVPAHPARHQGHQHERQHHGRQAQRGARAVALAHVVPHAGAAHATRMDADGLAPGLALLLDARIQGLGRLNLLARGLGAHRQVPHRFALAHDGGDVGLRPVEVAILAPVLHKTRPAAPAAYGGPHVLVGLGRHVRVADHVVRLAHEFFHGEATDPGKGCVAVRQHPFGVGGGHQQLVGREVVFVVGDGKVDAHR
jgi:hypothetical protein